VSAVSRKCDRSLSASARKRIRRPAAVRYVIRVTGSPDRFHRRTQFRPMQPDSRALFGVGNVTRGGSESGI